VAAATAAAPTVDPSVPTASALIGPLPPISLPPDSSAMVGPALPSPADDPLATDDGGGGGGARAAATPRTAHSAPTGVIAVVIALLIAVGAVMATRRLVLRQPGHRPVEPLGRRPGRGRLA
jgi:hypothetical protein